MATNPTSQELRQVPIGALIVDPNQPRRDFGREAELKENLAPLEALASSIKDQGILQPIIARPAGKNKLMIVAGERRWRAAQMAGLSSVPVLVREDLEGMSLELAQLSENLQRQDLTDLDVASALESLMERYPELRKKDLAKLLNRAPSYITRMLSLRNPEFSDLVSANVITYASVLEAFKGKSQAVKDMVLSEARETGKPITHYAMARAEKKLVHEENSVKVSPELYDQLMMDMGFGNAEPAHGKAMRLSPSGSEDFAPPPGSRAAASTYRIGTAAQARSENAPRQMLHHAKMGWDQFVALCELRKPGAKPVMVEVALTSEEVRACLEDLRVTIPREEFEQLPTLLDALRTVPPKGAPTKRMKKATR
jgi:ParB/RepB/Spo0J family partition protein